MAGGDVVGTGIGHLEGRLGGPTGEDGQERRGHCLEGEGAKFAKNSAKNRIVPKVTTELGNVPDRI